MSERTADLQRYCPHCGNKLRQAPRPTPASPIVWVCPKCGIVPYGSQRTALRIMASEGGYMGRSLDGAFVVTDGASAHWIPVASHQFLIDHHFILQVAGQSGGHDIWHITVLGKDVLERTSAAPR